jgi:uncharacterized protein (UPF0276 family)
MPADPPPSSAGIGLRTAHAADFRTLRPDVPFIEAHTENHLCGGPMRSLLHDLRCDYPISLHCVGLSIGSATGIDRVHLNRIRQLADEVDPMFVSDHLSVSSLAGLYSNDLIPVPLDQETLKLAANHIDLIQETLGRQLLVENPSCYIEFVSTEFDEGAFLTELAYKTGCGILCDVNNIYVTAMNRGVDPHAMLSRFAKKAVKEIHVAGHAREDDEHGLLLIDTHDRRACDEVLGLLAHARARFGDIPTLVEWDSKLPELDVLLDEAARIETHAKPVLSHACA